MNVKHWLIELKVLSDRDKTDQTNDMCFLKTLSQKLQGNLEFHFLSVSEILTNLDCYGCNFLFQTYFSKNTFNIEEKFEKWFKTFFFPLYK